MKGFKIFIDNLYFSLVVVLGSMIVLYIVLYILDGAADAAGFGFGFREFSVGKNILILLLIWVVGTCGISGFLTYRAMNARTEGEIDYTRRTR